MWTQVSRKSAWRSGDASTTSPAVFSTAVAQKTCLNGCFVDLCRRNCWASKAPGQPPAKASMCKLLSGVRQEPLRAAALSAAWR